MTRSKKSGTKDLFINPDIVVMRGEWAEEVVLDRLWFGSENVKEFQKSFEIVNPPALADPFEAFLQGAYFVRLIRRLSDDKLFGYLYWGPIGGGESTISVKPNGLEYGYNEDVYVWRPVKPFSVTGYRLQ